MTIEYSQIRNFCFGLFKSINVCLIAVLLLAGHQAGFAQQRTGEEAIRLSREAVEEITALCNSQHPNLIGDYLTRQDCIRRERRIVRDELRALREEEGLARRELAARPCVAEALPRIEQTIMRARASLNGNMRLQEIKIILDQNLSRSGSILVSDADINVRIYVNQVRFACATEFYFTIGVDVRRDDEVIKFSVWAHNAPVGYPDGSGREIRLARFERNFVEERADVARVAVSRRRDAARASLRVINRELSCANNDCRQYEYSVTIKNESSEIISSIEFKFEESGQPNRRCPPPISQGWGPVIGGNTGVEFNNSASMRNTMRSRTVLAPGETKVYSWRSTDPWTYMPRGRGDANFMVCATIGSIEIAS